MTFSTPMIRGRSSASPQTGARAAVSRASTVAGIAAAGTSRGGCAAPVLGGLGEPERPAGQRHRPGRPRPAARHDRPHQASRRASVAREARNEG